MILGKARQAGQAEHGKHMVGKVYVMFVCIYTNILGECSFAKTRKVHFTQQLAYRTLGHLLSTRRVPLQATLQVPGKRLLIRNWLTMQ